MKRSRNSDRLSGSGLAAAMRALWTWVLIYLGLSQAQAQLQSSGGGGVKDVTGVKLVLAAFRSGNSNPKAFLPQDDNRDVWGSEGEGQLSEMGKRQGIAIGRQLRDRYASLLKDSYDPSSIVALSSSAAPARQTIQAVLAGLVPGSSESHASWQPIPTTLNDPLLRVRGTSCPKARRLWAEIDAARLPSIRHALERQADLMDYVAGETGWSASLDTMSRVAGNLYNLALRGLSFPRWVSSPALVGQDGNSLFAKLAQFRDSREVACANYAPCRKIMASYWLGHVVQTLQAKDEGASDQLKLALYAADADSLLALMKLLDLDVNRVSASGGFLLELRDGFGGPEVRILQHSGKKFAPSQRRLRLDPKATYCRLNGLSLHWCPLSKFLRKASSKMSLDWKASCKESVSFGNQDLPPEEPTTPFPQLSPRLQPSRAHLTLDTAAAWDQTSEGDLFGPDDFEPQPIRGQLPNQFPPQLPPQAPSSEEQIENVPFDRLAGSQSRLPPQNEREARDAAATAAALAAARLREYHRRLAQAQRAALGQERPQLPQPRPRQPPQPQTRHQPPPQPSQQLPPQQPPHLPPQQPQLVPQPRPQPRPQAQFPPPQRLPNPPVPQQQSLPSRTAFQAQAPSIPVQPAQTLGDRPELPNNSWAGRPFPPSSHEILPSGARTPGFDEAIRVRQPHDPPQPKLSRQAPRDDDPSNPLWGPGFGPGRVALTPPPLPLGEQSAKQPFSVGGNLPNQRNIENSQNGNPVDSVSVLFSDGPSPLFATLSPPLATPPTFGRAPSPQFSLQEAVAAAASSPFHHVIVPKLKASNTPAQPLPQPPRPQTFLPPQGQVGPQTPQLGQAGSQSLSGPPSAARTFQFTPGVWSLLPNPPPPLPSLHSAGRGGVGDPPVVTVHQPRRLLPPTPQSAASSVARPPGFVQSAGSVASANCADEVPQYCPVWAQLGQCRKHPLVTIPMCQRSCGCCGCDHKRVVDLLYKGAFGRTAIPGLRPNAQPQNNLRLLAAFRNLAQREYQSKVQQLIAGYEARTAPNVRRETSSGRRVALKTSNDDDDLAPRSSRPLRASELSNSRPPPGAKPRRPEPPLRASQTPRLPLRSAAASPRIPPSLAAQQVGHSATHGLRHAPASLPHGGYGVGLGGEPDFGTREARGEHVLPAGTELRPYGPPGFLPPRPQQHQRAPRRPLAALRPPAPPPPEAFQPRALPLRGDGGGGRQRRPLSRTLPEVGSRFNPLQPSELGSDLGAPDLRLPSAAAPEGANRFNGVKIPPLVPVGQRTRGEPIRRIDLRFSAEQRGGLEDRLNTPPPLPILEEPQEEAKTSQPIQRRLPPPPPLLIPEDFAQAEAAPLPRGDSGESAEGLAGDLRSDAWASEAGLLPRKSRVASISWRAEEGARRADSIAQLRAAAAKPPTQLKTLYVVTRKPSVTTTPAPATTKPSLPPQSFRFPPVTEGPVRPRRVLRPKTRRPVPRPRVKATTDASFTTIAVVTRKPKLPTVNRKAAGEKAQGAKTSKTVKKSVGSKAKATTKKGVGPVKSTTPQPSHKASMKRILQVVKKNPNLETRLEGLGSVLDNLLSNLGDKR